MFFQVALLLCFLCLCFAQQPQNLTNPVRIYNTPTDGTHIKAFGVAMTACGNSIVVMDDSSRCIKYLNAAGEVVNWKCTPEMSTAIGMFIYASAGYIMNSAGEVVIIDMYSGDAIDVINATQTLAKNPYKIGLFTGFAVPTATHTWVMADNKTNTALYLPNWTINGMVSGTNRGTSHSYGSGLIVQLNNNKPILCLFNPTSTTFAVVYENSNTVDVYSWTKATDSPAQKFQYSFGGFGEIAACRSDFYNRVYLWDKGCNCLKVVDRNGAPIYNMTLPDVQGTPRDIQASRNKIYFHDDAGIISYDMPAMVVTFSQPVDPQPMCSTAQRTNVVTQYGAPPYFVVTLPEQALSSSASGTINNFFNNFTINISPRDYYTTPFTLFDDTFAPEYEALATNGVSSTSVPASVLAPQSGSLSWRMLMSSGFLYGIRTSSIYTGRMLNSFFATLEFYIYITPGVGPFRIDLSFGTTFGLNSDPAYTYRDILPGDVPTGQWTPITIDLSRGPSVTGFNRIVFNDLNTTAASTTSFIYVDNIRLLPYPTADHQFLVRDFCNATFVSAPFPVFRNATLTASVTSKKTSCNVAGAPHVNSTNNGAITAVISGGRSPYSLNWTFTANNSASTTLFNQKNLLSNIEVYGDDLNGTWADRSTGVYSLTATSITYSAPYSASIGPNAGALTFFYVTGISVATFKAIDFWVFGGPTGNQVITVSVLNVQAAVAATVYAHRVMGIPGIPRNVWYKVTIPLSSFSGVTGTYYGIQLRSSFNQPRVFFDNIRLISNDLTLTVVDQNGCTTSTQDVYVNNPQIVTVSHTVSRVQCFGDSTGFINLNAIGGTRPYNFKWSTNATTSSLQNLTANIYSVNVIDSNNCTSVPTAASISVLQPPALKVVPVINNASCYGGKGRIAAQVIGGVDIFSYKWTRTSTGEEVRPSPQNIPTPVFSDSPQNLFTIDASLTNYEIECQGARNDSAMFGYCALLVRPVSGSSSNLFGMGCSRCIDGLLYSHLKFWVKFEDPEDATSIYVMFSDETTNYTRAISSVRAEGWTEVTVELQDGLVLDNFALFSNNSDVVLDAFRLDAIVLVSRNSFNPGIGVGAGFTGVAELEVGSYTITVTDANACNSVTRLEIFQPEPLVTSFTMVSPNGNSSDGIVTAVASGGIPPYTYSWPVLSAQSDTVQGLAAGRYGVIITDANGCTLSATATLNPCNCFNGAVCSTNGTCICPEGLICDAAINRGGGGGLAGGKLAAVLVVPIVGGIVFVGLVGYFVFARKRARLVQEMASKQRSEINRSEIHLETRIGRGASGEVFKGTLRGTDVAVKKLINTTTSNIQEFMLESAVMCALRHPNIVLFMGSCFDHSAKEMLLVMEFLNRGSLHDVLHEPKEVLSYHLKLQICYQAAVGMNFLHQSDPPVIHRDLKSHNILLDDKYNAKISDFGITKFKEINKGSKKQNIAEKSSSLGTIFWTAPEVLDGYEATEKSDCYAFGVVLWEVFHMKDPYLGKDPLAVADQVLHKSLRPTMDERLPEEIKTLIRSCWDQDAKRRPSFQDVMVQLKALAIGSGAVFANMPAVSESIEPPTGAMYIVTMDIENIMHFWDTNTRDTLYDIQQLQDMYRTQLEVYMGYEFNSQLGSCSIAFSKIGHAINWCTTTFIKAMNLEYSPSLLSDPSGREVRSNTGETMQRGFRLNFGIFSGTPNCSIDPITNATKYFGAVVDTANRLARLANNGAIAASAQVVEDFEKSKPNLAHHIYTRKYNETLNSARSKNLEVYKIVVATLDHKDTSGESSRPGTPIMPHVVLTLGEVGEDTDGIETISITNKTRSTTEVKSNWLIPYSDLEIGEAIGRGNLGSYYKGKLKGKECAVNVLINQKLNASELLRLMADITIMSKMSHPNVLPYFGICSEANHISLAIEYGARNLSQIISNTTISLTPQIRTKIAVGIALGMQYISNHPDPAVRKNDNLKSNNIMVDRDWDVKVTDYGQANIKDFARTMTTVTSVAWTAPEVLNGDAVNEKVAQYSYGVILWELFARKQPYQDEHPIKVVSKICAGLRPPIPSEVPANFRKVIEGCWDINPDMRPLWGDIVSILNAD